MIEKTVRVNLHCHSNKSDGTLKPELVAAELASAGVEYCSLTDHDTSAGTGAFEEICRLKGMGFIPGVELTSMNSGGEIHILGYGTELDVADRHTGGPPPASSDVLRAIREAGGISVLAHPLHTEKDKEKLRALVRELKAEGLAGLETFYGPYTRDDRRFLSALADEFGLIKTAGTDFHGSNSAGLSDLAIEMPEKDWFIFKEMLLRGGGKKIPDKPPVGEAGHSPKKAGYAPRILMPGVLALSLFVLSLFAVIIPSFERTLLDRKKETIRELTVSAVSILAEYQREEQAGRLDLKEAQANAALRIRDIRYGKEGKDYFWITDTVPKMIMHPYRPDLEDRDVSGYTDEKGDPVFMEFVDAVRDKDEGYVEYLWQWKDDASRVVPKLSFVKRFAPWDWIVGTGIYLDDVNAEIIRLVRRFIWISLGISAAVALLLIYLIQQSLAAERERLRAVAVLEESHEKYRALTEASTEGLLAVKNGRLTFANLSLLHFLGMTARELGLFTVGDIFSPLDTQGEPHAGQGLTAELKGPAVFHVRKMNGDVFKAMVSASAFHLGGEDTVIFTVREMDTTDSYPGNAERLPSEPPFTLTAVGMGLLRISQNRAGVIVYADSGAGKLLGLPGEEDKGVFKNFFDLIEFPEERIELKKILMKEGDFKDRKVRIRKRDGGTATISLTASTLQNDAQGRGFRDILIEDFTEERRIHEEFEKLKLSMDANTLFLGRKASALKSPISTCDMNTPLRSVLTRLAGGGTSKSFETELVITGASGEAIGLVTTRDILLRGYVANLPLERPVYEIMSAPLMTLEDDETAQKALTLMEDASITRLILKDSEDKISGLLYKKSILENARLAPPIIQKEIEAAETPSGLLRPAGNIPALFEMLTEAVDTPSGILERCSPLYDALSSKTVNLAIAELGPPPRPFAFVVLGSQARREMMPGSDQDNAIIIGSGSGNADAAQSYFLRLGEMTATRLDRCGIRFCDGGYMAGNPTWCTDIPGWETHFKTWIEQSEARELMNFAVFFDMRFCAGDPAVFKTLRKNVFFMLANRPSFFGYLAQDCAQKKLPALPSDTGRKKRAGAEDFAVKEAIAPIVNFARLHALRLGLEETGTLNRLALLRDRDIILEPDYLAMRGCFEKVLRLRLLKRFVPLEFARQPRYRETLTGILTELKLVRKRIAFDFLGRTI